MKNEFKSLLILMVLFLNLGLMVSCDQEPTESFFDHLGNQGVVKMEIRSDFSELLDNKSQKVEKKATLKLETSQGTVEQYPVKISLRGKTRRQVCEFPPLKLNLDEDALEAHGLKTFDNYKLVTHCIDDSELVLKEFLAYKLYNQLTDFSFRVRLVKLTYIDKGGAMESIEQYGILLENYSEMAERFQAKTMPDQLPKNTKIPSEDYQRLALFQYMIGNTDWNLHKQHNIKWLRTKNGAIPVPYDFDYSGLVNAPYAKPHPSLPIDSVRERFLQYRGNDLQALEDMRSEIRNKQAIIIQTCEQFKALSADEKAELLNYLDDFFSMDQTAFAVR